MRIEEEITHASLNVHLVVCNSKGCTDTPRAPGDVTSSLYRRVRSEVRKNKPDKFGFRAPSPYSFSLEEIVAPQASAKSRWLVEQPTSSNYSADYADGYLYQGNLNKSILGNNLGISNLKPKQQIINAAFSSLKDQKINVAMTLAFVRESSDMISKRAIQLRHLYVALKGLNMREVARLLNKRFKKNFTKKQLGDLYLEGLFGWRQLYQDLMGAYDHLNKASRPVQSLVTGRAQSSHERPFFNAIKTNSFRSQLRVEGSNTSYSKCTVYGRVYSEGLQDAASLGLLNPVEVLWDVIRLSWIIDQFVHIGGYLSAYDALAGLSFLGGSYTEGQRAYASLSLESTGNVNSNVYGSADGHAIVQSFARDTVTSNDVSIAIRNPFQANVAVAAAAVIALHKTMSGGGPIPRHYRL